MTDRRWIQWADILALVVLVGHIILEVTGHDDPVFDEGAHAVITLYILGRIGVGISQRGT